jgi:hypothetical protein
MKILAHIIYWLGLILLAAGATACVGILACAFIVDFPKSIIGLFFAVGVLGSAIAFISLWFWAYDQIKQ